MSRNTIFVLMYHSHKLLDLVCKLHTLSSQFLNLRILTLKMGSSCPSATVYKTTQCHNADDYNSYQTNLTSGSGISLSTVMLL
jgi:hypothetical protein